MNLFRLLLTISTFSIVSGSFAATAEAGSSDKPRLVGQWTGPLPLPGGNHHVSITVSQHGDGTTTAMLSVPAMKLSNAPMRMKSSPDSVVFYADNIGCRFVAQPVADGKRLRGKWQQPGFRSMLVLNRVQSEEARATTTGVTKVRKAEHKGISVYQTEEVNVTSPGNASGETSLGGSLSMPVGPGPFPAVVLLSDAGATAQAGGTYALLDDLADYLTRQGLAVLRLDERGTGRSAAIPAANSGTELVADAQSALLFLRTHSGIDPMRVGVLGHGTGANVALVAAAQSPAPAFLVSLGAAGVNGQELLARQTSLVNQPGEPDTAQTAWAHHTAQALALVNQQQKAAGASLQMVQTALHQEQLRLNTLAKKRSEALYKRQYAMLEIIRQTPDNAQAQAIVANMLKQIYPALSPAAAQTRAGQLTSPWYRSFLAFNPQAGLTKVTCPALLLHGTADAQVPTATNLPLLEKGLKANKRVNIKKIDGVNHDFMVPKSEQALASGAASYGVASPEALETIREWVVQQVKPKQ